MVNVTNGELECVPFFPTSLNFKIVYIVISSNCIDETTEKKKINKIKGQMFLTMIYKKAKSI